MSFEFLYDQFQLLECLVGYRDDFVDLEERWASYRSQAFLVAFFGAMLFPSPLGATSFAVLPLVSVLPYGTFFIPALLFETIRSLSLCRETSRGRLGCCVHMLQLWFCSHLSVIARDQPMGFVSRNRVRATVSLNLPFSRDTDGWLRYLCSLSPTDQAWRVKWGITRWQGQTHCVGLLGIPLVGIWGCMGYFLGMTMRQFGGIQHILRFNDLFTVTCEYGLVDIDIVMMGRASRFWETRTLSICQDICESMLGTYINIELVNPLTKCTLLVIGQIQDVFNASRNKVSSLSVKAMQVYPRNKQRSARF